VQVRGKLLLQLLLVGNVNYSIKFRLEYIKEESPTTANYSADEASQLPFSSLRTDVFGENG
jgi:hypothetical protein